MENEAEITENETAIEIKGTEIPDSPKALREAMGVKDKRSNPESKGKPKSCGVCGKPESRTTSKVNEACPTHARAVAENWAGKFKLLEKALGDTLVDFAQRKKFNAQLEWLRTNLAIARAEHDKFQPSTPESDRALLVQSITESLIRLGVDVGENPAEGSEGKWSPLTLADRLHAMIGDLVREDRINLDRGE